MSAKKNGKKKPAAVESTDDSIPLTTLTDEEAAEVDAEMEADVEETPKLSRKEAVLLFNEYKEVDAGIAEAEAKILSLTAQRSNIVKAIHDGVGKGPFKFNGATVTIMTRTAKEEGSETAYFFKRLGSAVVDFDS
jgi:hypothetical protein